MKNAMHYTKISIGIAFFLATQFGQTLFCAKEKEIMVSPQGKVSESMLQLLALAGIEHDGSLISIVKETQAQWLRKPGQERWDIVDAPVENRDEFFKLFEKMNLIKEVKPALKKYDHALLMGATFDRAKDRLEHLVELSAQGVQFNSLVILAGARPLMEDEKSLAKSTYQVAEDLSPQTESELMILIYAKTNMPKEMRELPLTLIDVPMQLTNKGELTRPTTADTVNYWLAIYPVAGDCLVVSNQPYVSYQDSVTKSLLPEQFVVDTVGQVSVETKIGIYLDNLARCLYQEKIRLGL